MRLLKALLRGCPWVRYEKRRSKEARTAAATSSHVDVLESRVVLASTPMAIGMNIDNGRDDMPNRMFTDVFQHSRPWISHEYNTVTRQTNFNGNSFAINTDANGFDSERLPGFVAIPAGASSATITIHPIDERVFDPHETALLRLNSNLACTIGAQNSATATIIDNDAPPTTPIQPVLMVVANRDFHYREYSEPRLALEAAGIPVVAAAGSPGMAIPHTGTGYGAGDGAVRVDVTVSAADAADDSAICFVGGWGTSMYQFASTFRCGNATYEGTPAIRNAVNDLINDFVVQDKYISGVCTGVSVFAWSRMNGQSLPDDRMVTTAHFTSPTNNGGFGLCREHLKANGATALTGGELGTPVDCSDDVLVDGHIITADNFDAAPLLGRTLAAYLISGTATTTISFRTAFTSVSESTAAPILLPVIRNGTGEHALVVRPDISRSATEHVDFLWAPRRVPSQPRQTSIVVEMAPINDTINVADEDLFFERLGDPSYAIGNIGRSLLSILDND